MDVEAEWQAGKMDVPRSFVVRKGKVDASITLLVKDMRKVMAPNTAAKLRERRDNSIKDYVNLAGSLKVSHLLMFTQTERAVNLKLARMPHGPTLSFQVESYMLIRHVRELLRHPVDPSALTDSAPLVVLNNFGGGGGKHIALMTSMLQGMFPTIDIGTVRLSSCQRVVLFHMDKERDMVEFRHYAIKAVPAGVSRAVKQVLKPQVPDLSKLNDIGDLFGAAAYGYGSESEAEEESSKVELSERHGKARPGQSAIKLTELGPRMTLKLVKIDSGVASGDVLYHAFVKKTDEEAAALKKAHEEKVAQKAVRRKIQEENVRKKEEAKEAKAAAKRLKKAAALKRGRDEESDDEDESDDDDGDEEEEGGVAGSDGEDEGDDDDDDEDEEDDE